MIAFTDIHLYPETLDDLNSFVSDVEIFRTDGQLDPVALAKLKEHFKATHVYHSTGIEGNHLTIQETIVVLQEGIEINGKPLQESLDVKHLGEAFDYLQELCKTNQTLRETDIRDLHKLVIGQQVAIGPGEYRKVGVATDPAINSETISMRNPSIAVWKRAMGVSYRSRR